MKQAVVIGAGPAGLMAAEELAKAGARVMIADAKPSFGRKFLMAGKSGLNLTMDVPVEGLLPLYGASRAALEPALHAFGPQQVKDFAQGLGQEIFTGSTGRVFPKAMKASPVLRAWLARLNAMGVEMRPRWRWAGWTDGALEFVTPDGPTECRPDVTVLACGGASWPRLGSDGAWAQWVPTEPFKPSNVGLRVAWSEHMTKHFGAPIKTIIWRAGDVISRGEAVLTREGLEGGGIYSASMAVRDGAALTVDLAPDLSAENIAARYERKRTKDTWSKWARQALRLSPVKQAILREIAGPVTPASGPDWARAFKTLTIPVQGTFDIDSAISTGGGVPFRALDDALMLKERAGVFCAGEMLDWEAPTGGYLLTASFATGRWAGQSAARYLGLA